MTTVLCTLYNSLYLDKGLVLYDSLCECAKDFKLYVLCMDDKCYEVLTDLHQEHHIPIRLSDFERGDDSLLKAKANRPSGEYCWTCSSSFIRYILNKYNEPICTYIDADMYFYSDPQILIDEMVNAGKSVMVTPHRFHKKNEKLSKTVGTYCVEFNTFCNTLESLEVLEYWRNRCLECCNNLGDGIHWGDQKYLEELVQKFNCVYVCQNKGAGVAPWNIMLYKKTLSGVPGRLVWRGDSNEIPLVFFHYQAIFYVTRKIVNPNIQTHCDIDFSLVDSLYYPYLRKIEVKKQFLEKIHGICFFMKHHPTDKDISKWKYLIETINPRRLLYLIKNSVLHIKPYMINLSYEK